MAFYFLLKLFIYLFYGLFLSIKELDLEKFLSLFEFESNDLSALMAEGNKVGEFEEDLDNEFEEQNENLFSRSKKFLFCL